MGSVFSNFGKTEHNRIVSKLNRTDFGRSVEEAEEMFARKQVNSNWRGKTEKKDEKLNPVIIQQTYKQQFNS